MTVLESIYSIEATKKTPRVHFDKSKGELNISGKSLPEYSYGFYGNILDEVEEYIQDACQTTTLTFNLDYLNSISSKMIMQLILKFDKLMGIGKEVKIIWHYHAEDDMMLELINVYSTSTSIPVKLIEIEE